MYKDENNNYNYLKMIRCRIQLWLLRMKLFWTDLFVDVYYRWYLQEKMFDFN